MAFKLELVLARGSAAACAHPDLPHQGKVPAGRMRVFSNLLQGEGARRADEGQLIPSSVSLRSPALPSARKQSQEKLFVPTALASFAFGAQAVPGEAFFQFLTEGLRSRRGEASLINAPMKANHFHWDASPVHLITKAHYAPAGRMRGFLPSPRGSCPQGG